MIKIVNNERKCCSVVIYRYNYDYQHVHTHGWLHIPNIKLQTRVL